MAVVTAAAYQKIGHVFSNEQGFAKLTYNFSADGGAFADTHRLALVQKKILITEAVVQVETACTSGGSATVAIGAETADPDGLLAATAVASLTDDATFVQAAGQQLVVGANDYLTLDIAVADLTAGKINVYLKYYNAA